MSCYILGTKEQMAGFIKLHRDTETFHWSQKLSHCSFEVQQQYAEGGARFFLLVLSHRSTLCCAVMLTCSIIFCLLGQFSKWGCRGLSPLPFAGKTRDNLKKKIRVSSNIQIQTFDFLCLPRQFQSE